MSIFFRNPNLLNCFRQTKIAIVTSSPNGTLVNHVRFFSVGRTGGRAGRVVSRSIPITKERRSIKEILLQPTTGIPFSLGSSAVAGASFFGLGALCYYGLGLSKTPGTFENA